MERLLKHFPDSYQAHAVRSQASNFDGVPIFSTGGDYGGADSLSIDDKSVGTTETAESDVPVDKETAEFTVQASAFTDKNNALKLFRRLKAANFNAHLSLKTVANKYFYLVQVDYFRTREEAEKMAERVTSFTGIKAHIINLR
jgi:cell division septation protein DedD